MSPRWIFGIVWIDWKIHVCAKCRNFCFYLIIEHCIYTRPIYTPSKTLLETHDRCNKQLQGIEQKCKAWILKVLLWNYDENINKIGCFFFLLILCHEEIARITHWNVIGTNDQAYRFFFVLRSQENSSRGTVKPCAENHVRNRRRSSSIRNRYCVCDYEICNIFFFFFSPRGFVESSRQVWFDVVENFSRNDRALILKQNDVCNVRVRLFDCYRSSNYLFNPTRVFFFEIISIYFSPSGRVGWNVINYSRLAYWSQRWVQPAIFKN